MINSDARGTLRSERLKLVPFSAGIVPHLAPFDREALSEIVGAQVHDSWPGPDLEEAFPVIREMLLEAPARAEWFFLLLLPDEGVVVGDIGLIPSPERNAVELGYSIVEDYRRRGFAREAATTVIEAFRNSGSEELLIAACESSNAGSIRVLESVGMVCISEGEGRMEWTLAEKSDEDQLPVISDEKQ